MGGWVAAEVLSPPLSFADQAGEITATLPQLSPTIPGNEQEAPAELSARELREIRLGCSCSARCANRELQMQRRLFLTPFSSVWIS